MDEPVLVQMLDCPRKPFGDGGAFGDGKPSACPLQLFQRAGFVGGRVQLNRRQAGRAGGRVGGVRQFHHVEEITGFVVAPDVEDVDEVLLRMADGLELLDAGELALVRAVF